MCEGREGGGGGEEEGAPPPSPPPLAPPPPSPPPRSSSSLLAELDRPPSALCSRLASARAEGRVGGGQELAELDHSCVRWHSLSRGAARSRRVLDARFERDVDVRHVAPCTGRRRGPHDLRERRTGFLPRARDGEKFSHCAVRMRSELSHLDRDDQEAIVTHARRAYSHRGALAHVIFTQNTLHGCAKKGTLRDCARHSSWSFERTGETRTSP